MANERSIYQKMARPPFTGSMTIFTASTAPAPSGGMQAGGIPRLAAHSFMKKTPESTRETAQLPFTIPKAASCAL
jgi:hypothetical protein